MLQITQILQKTQKNENVFKTCLKRVKTVLVACLKQIKRSIIQFWRTPIVFFSKIEIFKHSDLCSNHIYNVNGVSTYSPHNVLVRAPKLSF